LELDDKSNSLAHFSSFDGDAPKMNLAQGNALGFNAPYPEELKQIIVIDKSPVPERIVEVHTPLESEEGSYESEEEYYTSEGPADEEISCEPQ
jgi:hypothetical protein